MKGKADAHHPLVAAREAQGAPPRQDELEVPGSRRAGAQRVRRPRNGQLTATDGQSARPGGRGEHLSDPRAAGRTSAAAGQAAAGRIATDSPLEVFDRGPSVYAKAVPRPRPAWVDKSGAGHRRLTGQK